MRIAGLIVALVVAAGCGVEEPPLPTAIDASDVDGSTLPACTGVAYDPCTDNTQCMSANCRLFNGDGIQICTVSCDAVTPCPDFDGMPVACNMMGRCNPRNMNACMR